MIVPKARSNAFIEPVETRPEKQVIAQRRCHPKGLAETKIRPNFVFRFGVVSGMDWGGRAPTGTTDRTGGTAGCRNRGAADLTNLRWNPPKGYIVSGCWELERKFQLAPNSKRQAGNCDAAESAKLSAARTGWPWCGNGPTTAFRARSSGVGQRVRVFTVRRIKILCISV